MTNSSLQTMNIQETIEKLLRATGREHVEELLTIMRDNGYYRVGCHGHHRWQGGLAQHHLEVLLRMQRQNDADIPTTSIIVVALLHDLCNIRGFEEIRHHGSRSVLIATRKAGFKLTSTEYQAILWHMHGEREKGKLGAQFDAVLENPLWKLLRKADRYSAAHPMIEEELMEVMGGKPHAIKEHVVELHSEGHSSDLAYEPAERSGVSKPRLKTHLSEEEKLRQNTRRKFYTVADMFDLLSMRGVYVPQETQLEIIDEFERNYSTIDNRGFLPEFLAKASPKDIEYYRTVLYDLCQYRKNGAKYVAKYLYEDTKGVFNFHLGTDEMYEWLKDEFNIYANLGSFYKTRPVYDHYRTTNKD